MPYHLPFRNSNIFCRICLVPFVINCSNLICSTQIASEDHSDAILANIQKEAYFVDFLRDAPEATGDEPDDVELEAPKMYEPIPSFDELSERLKLFMEQYNEAIRGAKMDLVFFKVQS